jgi:hypothetical protein
VYSALGAQLLPSDVENAIAGAKYLGPVTETLGHRWTTHGVEVRWRIFDQARWSGVLAAPQEYSLEGSWRLLDALNRELGSLKVKGPTAWGKLAPTVKKAVGIQPAELDMVFVHADRTARLTVRAIDAVATIPRDEWDQMIQMLGPLPVVLACNKQGFVWWKDGHRTEIDRRRFFDQPSPAIGQVIVPAVLSAKPEGGGFALTAKGVVMLDGGRLICVVGDSSAMAG